MPATLSDQITFQHPVFISALGLPPLLARSETLVTALGMSLMFVGSLLLSVLMIGTLRCFTPWSYRLIFILLVTATCVTVVDRFVQAWFFELHARLGIYIPLIAVNTLLLATLEEKVLCYPFKQTVKTAALTGLLVLLVITVAGMIRELLGRGGLFLDAAALVPGISMNGIVVANDGLPVITTAAGAFLVLGCVIAGVRFFQTAVQDGKPDR